MTVIATADLTTVSVDGTGIFDVLMRSAETHLDQEFKKSRIKGPEYATVYLGSLTAVLNASLQYLLSKQRADKEAELLDQQRLQAVAQTALITQQTLNAVTEGLVLVAQKCKLEAEFDVLMETKLKTATETALLLQKVATEKGQTLAVGVDADSIIGRQKNLYLAQTNGFTRDAEQKAAGVLVDSWKVRRSTDEGTVADATNKLNDATIGRVVEKLLNGVGA